MELIKDTQLFAYKGMYWIKGVHEESHLDTMAEFDIRGSDIFVVTYPKSGTTWMQYILAQMYHSHELKEKLPLQTVPWVEVHMKSVDYINLESPRTFVSHMPSSLMPLGLQKRGKVIYLARNPKDVAVSFFHFHNVFKMLENKDDFGNFLQDFLQGRVFGGSWFDHVKDWYNHREEFNILFLTYEEMVKDPKGTILKISDFIGKSVDDQTLENIVEKSSFNNMKQNQSSNYSEKLKDYFDSRKGSMMRKGKVGDWKSSFTVKENEMFDRIYKEKMADVPVDFMWDL